MRNEKAVSSKSKVKVYKRVGSVIKTQDFKPKKKEKFILSLMEKYQGDGYIRKGNFTSEIIWDGSSYMFPPAKSHSSYKKGLFLFGMVRKDAKAFIKSGKKLKVPKRYPVNEFNDNFNDISLPLTGTDLNHAYWRIALNLGIISKNTYIRGLEDDFKTVRLAALSTLGKGKAYNVIKNGVITDDVVNIGNDESMDALYKAIRYTCYKYMQVIKKKLGKDFVCYRTDCVYYVDTPQNRKLVRDYFKSENMEYKQLQSTKKALHE